MKTNIHILFLTWLLVICSVSSLGEVAVSTSVYCENFVLSNNWSASVIYTSPYVDMYAQIKSPTQTISNHVEGFNSDMYIHDALVTYGQPETMVHAYGSSGGFFYDDRWILSASSGCSSVSYDPQLSCKANALARSAHPISSIITPDPFIPLTITAQPLISSSIRFINPTLQGTVSISHTLVYDILLGPTTFEHVEIPLFNGTFTSDFSADLYQPCVYQTQIPNTPEAIWLLVSVQSQITQVPEPATLLLLALGGFVLRRNRN